MGLSHIAAALSPSLFIMCSSLYAVQHVRRMRGGSQAQFLRASDGNFYVTKFQNNPQHTRVLANEMIASRLGKWLSLPVPEVAVIEVSEWLIQHTPELCFEGVGHSVRCQSGLHLGSRYPVDPWEGNVFDYLPESMFDKVRNADDFPRMMVLDKWAGNADGRQAIFSRSGRQRKFTVTFIDQGYCFNAGEWTFTDLALHGVYYRNYVYAGVTGWESFEPVLTKAEEADELDVWRAAESVPPEWYGYDYGGLEKLVQTLYERRPRIRDLITAFRDSSRNPFPNWKQPSFCAVPSSTWICKQQAV